ncbi:Uncharacterised protein [Acinetobacter johnsonii]|uniref:Uncharacterized protein n=1 Tax=Acinetobacter johnsonii TaxID=40214 RepID=A0A239RSJ8_ACIJO|nr:hypothetical protein [Acinetobacter johnsonii]RSE17254.1 hypothetical protein EGT73_17370 [Acinetobacter johnsonii]SNU13555.1 Uncharacterised protein [Acinetobacter johnsonii]
METIIRHLSNLFDGAGVILEAPHKQRKYKRVTNGFHQDQNNLRNDVNIVGNEIQNKAREAYGR